MRSLWDNCVYHSVSQELPRDLDSGHCCEADSRMLAWTKTLEIKRHGRRCQITEKVFLQISCSSLLPLAVVYREIKGQRGPKIFLAQHKREISKITGHVQLKSRVGVGITDHVQLITDHAQLKIRVHSLHFGPRSTVVPITDHLQLITSEFHHSFHDNANNANINFPVSSLPFFFFFFLKKKKKLCSSLSLLELITPLKTYLSTEDICIWQDESHEWNAGWAFSLAGGEEP